MVARRLRSTKVVGTIGPACDSPAQIRELIVAGLNVARLNFSHGNHEQHAEVAERVRAAARELNLHIAIMGDTRGPEIRTGLLRDGPVELKEGELFTLRSEEGIGDATGVYVTHAGLPDDVQSRRSIYLDDGSIQLSVHDIRPGEVECIVMRGGILGERKGVSVPGASLSLPALGDTDVADLRFAAEQRFDYIAASFVRSAEHVQQIRQVLRDAGNEIPIIAKIEHPSAVDNLVEIVAAADGTMVARGDLGIEMPVEQVPLIQKRIIRVTVRAGKPVITATQMLDSMERHLVPTRAEVSDVANAILDGTSAVMLSGETAVGAHPVEAVRTMAALAIEAERSLADYGHFQHVLPEPSNMVADAIGQAAIAMASHVNAAAILALTETGFTVRVISKYRPSCVILGITIFPEVVRRFAMNWGVAGVLCEPADSNEEMIARGIERGRALGYLQSGDLVVAAAGTHGGTGTTDSLRVLAVD
jgi:pyruvate kinase